jgi:oligopeptide/dipeptide ABC transporter ATP-binding protein
MASVPRLREVREPTHIAGQPPNLLDLPGGCRFADRCPARFERCVQHPPVLAVPPDRGVRCWLHDAASAPGAADG